MAKLQSLFYHVLKQGDPLSSYLFVLCMERLTQWIEAKNNEKLQRPIKASISGPTILHLLIVYDVLLFAEPIEDQVDPIKFGLGSFCKASGQ